MEKKQAINITRMVAIPLILITIFSTSISVLGFIIATSIFEQETISSGIEITEMFSLEVTDYLERERCALEELNERMMVVGRTVIKNRVLLSDEYLTEFIEMTDVRHIYWYNPQGVILYDGRREFIGWQAKEGDPIHDFMISGLPYYIGEIRKDTDAEEFHKNIYIRANDGYFVQVGVSADAILAKIEQFQIQVVLDDLIERKKNVLYGKIVTPDMIVAAHTNREEIGKYDSDNENYLESLNSEITLVHKVYYPRLNENALEIISPIVFDGEVFGILILGYSLVEQRQITVVLTTIFTGLTAGFIIFYVLAQQFQVVMPLKKLNTRMDRINLNKIKYREPIAKEGTFSGLYNTLTILINRIVDSNNSNKKLIEDINNQLLIDNLTKIPNRFASNSVITEKLANNSLYALMLLDIDDFKIFNDTKGHGFGDEILIEVATVLNHLRNDNIFVARYGGDEFIFLQEYKELLDIEEFLGNIYHLLKTPITIRDHHYFINASVGVSLFPKDGTTYEELVRKADIAMYNAKNVSHTSFMFYDEVMFGKIEQDIQVVDDLKSALKNDGFELVYQPQIQIDSKEVVSLEALLRLKGKRISPGIFIPLAEKYRLINRIGRVVIEMAIEQMVRWRDDGVQLKTVYVNFSAHQLDDERIVDYIENLLKENNLEPELFGVEVTETALIEQSEQVVKVIDLMKKAGLKTAIDDFGAGQAGINYLSNFQVDTVKLDKSFSDKYLKTDQMEIFNTVVQLCELLGFNVLAEGLETKEQVELLKGTTCRLVQGYYYYKPQKPGEIPNILKMKNKRK